MVYELYGYDSYDCEYYPIGYYSTFEKALSAEKKLISQRRTDQDYDILDVIGIQEYSKYFKSNEEEIRRLLDRDPSY